MKNFLLFFCLIFSSFSKYDAARIDSCDDVLEYYGRTNAPVSDCYNDILGNSTFWRIDRKQPFDEARSQCKSAGDNADMAVVKSFKDQQILNELFEAKVIVNSWMWLGIVRNSTNGKLAWVDNTDVPEYRWYPYLQAKVHDCGIMLILSNFNADQDVSGTFYFTEQCDDTYIVACQATDVHYIP